MSIFQPGKSAWTVRMTKLSSGSYRATVTLKTGGSAGTLKISVQAKDAKGKLEQDLPEAAALVGNRRTRGLAPVQGQPHRTAPDRSVLPPSGTIVRWSRRWAVPRVDRMSQLVRASVRPMALITLALVAQAGWAAPAMAGAPVSRGPDTAGLRQQYVI